MRKNGFAPIVLIIIIAAALILGGGTLYYAKKSSAPAPRNVEGPQVTSQPPTAPPSESLTSTLDKVFCGGIAAGAFLCPEGYTCKLDGNYPDAGGVCVKMQKSNQDVVCIEDVKQCPNGSYVSRVPPSCKFQACPNIPIKTPTSTSSTANGSASLTANWPRYRNIKYGFEFLYPPDHTAYAEMDWNKKSLTAAGPYDNHVSVAEDESKIFSGERVVLKIYVVNEDMRIDDWIAQNLPRYVVDVSNISRKNTTVAGKAAVEITQPAQGVNSVHKLVVIQPGNFFVVVTESAPSALLDQVFATFKFMQ